ncbi:MAG: SIMPL domain-containing protein [Acidimicrobiia bacterium]
MSGQELGQAISINETVSSAPPPVFYEAAAADAARETPIEPGTSAVTISLSVNFALGG